MSDADTRGRRRAGRRPAQNDEAHKPAPARSLAYRHLLNPYEPLKVFSADHIAAMHEAALDAFGRVLHL